ncbi:flagellar assembly protein FliH [Caballeronia sp. LP006]|jgi:flagellar assembly protein FliH|uniref:flagellar assembly protein FliH n=1 Tax=unclassified Caballeronia TaxID=2646786 RepID=UPI0020285EF3|nr:MULTISPECIES: flagellar assembly protein FliH [unclassified Caballeronia]MDR5772851.1 flagellar assembly protein FliH [Caballeronia sp. LZ002]MDR5803690.1 flagellar assembly protein FliH [Caballeronia sp. LZ001]MDR5829745.1 flagellar assembly protein FliH [Caballeronia sp. LP006]MDR5848285.1 flagellar assembly protein FliH [Caballeronia sp. LZ003]
MSNPAQNPKAPLSAYQRWEMASFDPVTVDHSAADQAALEAHLRRVEEDAHAQGLATGHVAGQAIGYQAGFEQGHAKGFEDGRKEALAEAARLAEIADAFRIALQAADAAIAETLATLAVDIAQQVVRQHLAHDPTALVTVAREVIAAEPELTGSPTLIVNPADLPIVDAYLQEELGAAGWMVRPDPLVERGGCRAHAASGEIDSTNASRWERVAAALGRNKPW